MVDGRQPPRWWIFAALALAVVGAIAIAWSNAAVIALDAPALALLLIYLFAVTLGSALGISHMMRRYYGSWWLALALPMLCFLPMLIGYLPVSDWMFDLGFKYGHGNTPSSFWLLVFMGPPLYFGLMWMPRTPRKPAPLN